MQPTLINLARTLSGAGYLVTIYGTPTSYPDPGDLGPGVQVQDLASNHLWGVIEKLAGLPYLGRLSGVRRRLAVWDFAFRGVYEELRRHRQTGDRTVYIGVDGRGALAASLASSLLRTPYAFLSLELRLTAQQLAGLRGMVGRSAFRRASCVVVQGQDRRDVLERQFGWMHQKVFFLPNGRRRIQALGSRHQFSPRTACN